MNNHINEILLSLSRGGVKFVVCGGVASVLHGVERMTMDIDVAVLMEEENLNRTVEILTEVGLVPRAPVPADYLVDKKKRKMMIEEKNALVFTFYDVNKPYRQIDIFLDETASYEKIIKNAVSMKFEKYVINVISIDDLIEMKQKVVPSRDKDIFDINALMKIKNEK